MIGWRNTNHNRDSVTNLLPPFAPIFSFDWLTGLFAYFVVIRLNLVLILLHSIENESKVMFSWDQPFFVGCFFFVFYLKKKNNVFGCLS